MTTEQPAHGPASRVGPLHVLVAATVLAAFVMPVAFAHEGATSPATKSASVNKQIKRLKQRVAALEAKPDQVGQVPAALPPSGPAGGDLTGAYPNPEIGLNRVGAPEIAPNAVGGGKVADLSLGGADLAFNSLGGPQVLEPDLLIPRAWAQVDDPAGTAGAADPSVAVGEGVMNVNDGDGATGGENEGSHCFELGFTPDLILAVPASAGASTDRVVQVGTDPGTACAAGFDALVRIIDISAAGGVSSTAHVAFFDL